MDAFIPALPTPISTIQLCCQTHTHGERGSIRTAGLGAGAVTAVRHGAATKGTHFSCRMHNTSYRTRDLKKGTQTNDQLRTAHANELKSTARLIILHFVIKLIRS